MNVEKKRSVSKAAGKQTDNAEQTGRAFESEDYTGEELGFAVFCIENVAARLHVDAAVVYDVFTRDSNILDDYIIPCYDVLHTQGKDYIVNDLIDMMKEKGVMV